MMIGVAFAVACASAQAQKKPEVAGDSAVLTAPGQGAAARMVSISASVEAIDTASRTLTLKGPKGNVVDLPAGPEVKNFDQIKVGDFVLVRYFESLALELKKGSGIRERSERQASETAKPGAQPAAGAARQITVVADVVAVNAKTQTLTLRGPKRTVDLRLRDPEQIKLVKVGDQVEATYTEAVAVSVEPAPKPAAKKDDKKG
jgi:Cu/Ag efflux protein CusF